MRAPRITGTLAAVGLVTIFLAGCSSGGSDEATTTSSTTSTTVAESTTTTTEVEETTTTAAVATTAAPTTPATTAAPTTEPNNGLSPGDPCSLEEGSPDCIDPDGDGEGTYLIDGAACLSTHPDPSMCDDLDGDGHAGYPDSE